MCVCERERASVSGTLFKLFLKNKTSLGTSGDCVQQTCIFVENARYCCDQGEMTMAKSKTTIIQINQKEKFKQAPCPSGEVV